MHEALRVVNAVRTLDVCIEQPCLSYDECLSVRRMCPLPFVMDESMDDIGGCVFAVRVCAALLIVCFSTTDYVTHTHTTCFGCLHFIGC